VKDEQVLDDDDGVGQQHAVAVEGDGGDAAEAAERRLEAAADDLHQADPAGVDVMKPFRLILLFYLISFVANTFPDLTIPRRTRVARFFLVQHTKTGENIPNDHKIYQIDIKYF
jgi:hypothetical protein